MKLRKSFVMYHDYWGMFRLLTDEEIGKLTRAIFLYETENTHPTALDDKLNMLFYIVKEQLDKDKASYAAVCNKNKENAKIRWQKKAVVQPAESTEVQPFLNI